MRTPWLAQSLPPRRWRNAVRTAPMPRLCLPGAFQPPPRRHIPYLCSMHNPPPPLPICKRQDGTIYGCQYHWGVPYLITFTPDSLTPWDRERLAVEAEHRRWVEAVVRLARPKTCRQLLGLASGGTDGVYTVFPPDHPEARHQYQGVRFCRKQGRWICMGGHQKEKGRNSMGSSMTTLVSSQQSFIPWTRKYI